MGGRVKGMVIRRERNGRDGVEGVRLEDEGSGMRGESIRIGKIMVVGFVENGLVGGVRIKKG